MGFQRLFGSDPLDPFDMGPLLERVKQQEFPPTPRPEIGSYRCSICRRTLEEIGIPPHLRMAQMYGKVVVVGESLPKEVLDDPFLYRGLFCDACVQVFCPSCANMQTETCPKCGLWGQFDG